MPDTHKPEVAAVTLALAVIVCGLKRLEGPVRGDAVELLQDLCCDDLEADRRADTTALLIDLLVEDQRYRAGDKYAPFAEIVRRHLGESGLSRAGLARRIGVSVHVVNAILSRVRRPQLETVVRFAKALGAEPEELTPGG